MHKYSHSCSSERCSFPPSFLLKCSSSFRLVWISWEQFWTLTRPLQNIHLLVFILFLCHFTWTINALWNFSSFRWKLNVLQDFSKFYSKVFFVSIPWLVLSTTFFWLVGGFFSLHAVMLTRSPDEPVNITILALWSPFHSLTDDQHQLAGPLLYFNRVDIHSLISCWIFLYNCHYFLDIIKCFLGLFFVNKPKHKQVKCWRELIRFTASKGQRKCFFYTSCLYLTGFWPDTSLVWL